MFAIKRVCILTIASVLAVAVVCVQAGAQGERRGKRWGSEAMPREGACFFEDSDFRGQYFCVDSNDDLRKLPKDMRDRISSLRVIGNVGAVVFRDEKFKGPSGRFLTDVRDLRRQGWNDQISSVRVTKAESAWDVGRLPAWGRQALPKEGACFYRDIGFNGDYFCMPRGASYAQVPEGFNDQISSIRLIRAGGVMIFRDREFDGDVTRLNADVADLRRGVWNDRISSIRVF